MKKLQRLLLLMLCGIASGNAAAVALLFDPVEQLVGAGTQATIDVLVGDLDGEFVGAFDFTVSWDASILEFAAIEFDWYLGAPLSLRDYAVASGSVSAAEVALTGLLPNQDGMTQFRLFSITFDALAAGESALDFSGNIAPDGGFLANLFGTRLETSTTSGSITVVSEPALPLLLFTGLSLLFFARRRARDSVGQAA